MVPRVAQRGHSFKGAGLYYLHDKGASTSERVAWTHTHNLPTDDPEKAMRWMARTSMNAERLKTEAGVARTGRKSSAGSVYSFSLAWHPEQNPEKEHMLNAVFETLDRLGLNEHQAVMVAHQETEHPHVHVICNLVNPNDGRINVPSYDFLKFSAWAEDQERKNDKIYCEERVKNNERRRGLAKENRESGIVKYKEERPEFATQIQEIYNRSDNGKSFAAALTEAGFTLAKGDRRGFVLVDGEGKIYSLSRQLQGQRASDLKARLSDIDEKSLPNASTVADERRYFDREQYEVERQKAIVDAAIKMEQERQVPKEKKNADQEDGALKASEALHSESDVFLADLDKRRTWEQDVQRRRDQLEIQLSEFYGREKLVAQLEALRHEAKNSNTVWGRTSGKLQALKNKMSELTQNLGSMDKRIEEQRNTFEVEIQRNRTELFPSKDIESKNNMELDGEELKDSFIKMARRENDLDRHYPPNPERGHDLGL